MMGSFKLMEVSKISLFNEPFPTIILEVEKSTFDILGELSKCFLSVFPDFKIGGLLLLFSFCLVASPSTGFEEDRSALEPLFEPLLEHSALDLLLSPSSLLLLLDLARLGLTSTILSLIPR